MTDQQTVTYERLDAALAGEVIPNIGQLQGVEKKAFERAVRAGKLAKWRGAFFPVAGAPFGLHPFKTCYGLPEIRDYWAKFVPPTRAKTAA